MSNSLRFATVQEFPRLLLLSDEGPQTTSAGGLILFRLLKDYPVDLLQVIARDIPPNGARLGCSYHAIRTPWRRLEQSRFHRYHRSLRSFGLVPVVSAAKVDAMLSGFRPEVVLCVMQFSSYYEVAWRYARERSLPLVVIVHDVNEEWESVFPWARRAQRQRDGAFYRYASRRLCISPEMEQLCAERYGARGAVQYPNRDERIQPRDIEISRSLIHDGHLTIGFAGNLNYGYGAELVRMLPMFRETSTRLVLFAPSPGPDSEALIKAKDCCEFHGFVPALDAWDHIKRNCDAVLLPYPHTPGLRERLYRYHFPSKLPEYLALGMPVVVTGPQTATGVCWALRHPEAAVVATSLDQLQPLLTRLRNDGKWRVALARSGLQAGKAEFDPVKVKEEFLRMLCEAAGNIWALSSSLEGRIAES